MYIDKKHLLYGLFALLAVFYALNILLTNSITSSLIVKPVKLNFLVLEAPIESCEGCFDGDNVISRIDATHNIKYKTKNASFDSKLSKQTIEKYSIKNLPAVIITGDTENEQIVGSWTVLAAEEKEGAMVVENLLPYFNLETNEATGVVEVTLLTDESCVECFDAKTYLNIISRFGLFPLTTDSYDVSSEEGAALVEKYGISKLPALLLSNGASKYDNFNQVWPQVGTVEEDGWYVFREVQELGLEYTNI